MPRIRPIVLVTFTILFSALASGHDANARARSPECRKVHAQLTLQASSDPACVSPIGLCAGGVLKGSLSGRSSFIGTSSLPSIDTPSSGVVLVTGDNRIQTERGELFTKDAIVLRTTGAGEFAEIDTVLGGTGEWAGASGILTATGTFANGRGEGELRGEICK